MNSEYVSGGHGSDFDHRTSGRWSREEHEKFIEGIISKDIYPFSNLNKEFKIFQNFFINIFL